jgi:nucleoside-diphosphate-sugar epimerase
LDNLNKNIHFYTIEDNNIDDIFKKHEFDIVIHTATSYGRKNENLNSIVKANLSFPLEILNAAIKNNVKYFINTDTSLPKNLNLYTHSKKQFLEWLEIFSNEICVLNLQLEYFYGPNDDESKFITYVLNELRANKEYINFTSGKSFRDFIYIDDVITAFLLLLNNIEKVNGILSIPIGTGKAEMLKHIVEDIQKIANFPNVKLKFGALPDRENEIKHSSADISYLTSIGWRPKFNFKEGIEEILKIEQ